MAVSLFSGPHPVTSKTPTTKKWDIKHSQKKLNIYVYMLQNVYFPNLFTPKCYVFFQKRHLPWIWAYWRWWQWSNGVVVFLWWVHNIRPAGLGRYSRRCHQQRPQGKRGELWQLWILSPLFFGKASWEGDTPCEGELGFPNKNHQKLVDLRKIEAETKALHDFFGGGSGYFCQGTMVIRSCFFEALFEVLYSSKWIKMAKKRRKHVFPNDPTLAKWKRSNFAQWAATLKDPRWHGSSPEAYIEVTYMFGGVYVAKTLHFYVVLGGSWYKKLAFLSLELTLGKKDQTFSTCSCLEELKVVRMGITTNGNVHTSYSSIIFILFLPVHIFYLGKWSPSEKK